MAAGTRHPQNVGLNCGANLDSSRQPIKPGHLAHKSSGASSLSHGGNKRLAALRHIALDLDDTLYRGHNLFPETLPFLQLLDSLGIGYSFVTNNSSRSVSEYLAHFENMGLKASREQVLISSHAAARKIQKLFPNIRRIFIVGAPGMAEEFALSGFECVTENPEAIVIGYDPNLNFQSLCKAAWWIKKGLPFIATNPDRTCPTDSDHIFIDCGAVCAALREATGRSPDIIAGKPDPTLLQIVMDTHRLAPNELAMVGDRLETDIAMGRRASAASVLVLTGEFGRTARQDPAHCIPAIGSLHRPDFIFPNLEAFARELMVQKKFDPLRTSIHKNSVTNGEGS